MSTARGPVDLVLASYVLGELADREVAATLWAQAGDTIAFVEPGTPAGYRRILAAREAVLAAGGHTVAPCPHDLPCPLRVPTGATSASACRARACTVGRRRSNAASKTRSSRTRSEPPADARAAARIIRPPQLRSGHVHLATCEPDGIQARTVSRRQGAAYRTARGAAWGDALEAQAADGN